MLSHESHIMERYVTTTYHLHDLHICEQYWYVTTTYHLYTFDENYCDICLWNFQSYFFVCSRRAGYVRWLRKRLSTSLADVPQQYQHNHHSLGSMVNHWFHFSLLIRTWHSKHTFLFLFQQKLVIKKYTEKDLTLWTKTENNYRTLTNK